MSYERLNIPSTKYKYKYSLDLNCFETKRNVDDVDVYLINIQYNKYWLHERVTWEIVTPEKTNVKLFFVSVNIGFLRVTISHVTLSCSQYLYNVTIKCKESLHERGFTQIKLNLVFNLMFYSVIR